MLYDWINLILLGALLGAVGQGARAVVGWKKVFDEARMTDTTAADMFQPGRLVASLIVGAIAGTLAALTLVDNPTSKTIGSNATEFKQLLLSLVAIGYAGTDFIEGFVRNSSASAAAGDRQAKPVAKDAAKVSKAKAEKGGQNDELSRSSRG